MKPKKRKKSSAALERAGEAITQEPGSSATQVVCPDQPEMDSSPPILVDDQRDSIASVEPPADRGKCREHAADPGPYTMTPWRVTFTKEEREKWDQELGRKSWATVRNELANHAVPLILIGALLLMPRLILVWFLVVMLWWAIEAVYKRMGPGTRFKLRRLVPESWVQSRVFKELSEGMEQVRPFFLASLYMFCIPFAIVWMCTHWWSRINKSPDQPSKKISSDNAISFVQNKRKIDEEEEANFFHSPAFAVTCSLIFLSGLPAAVTYLLYQHLGIDAILGFPSTDPRFVSSFVTTGLYFCSVAWCLSVLFFRSWFTFPLNFAGYEEEIELNGEGIRRHSHSWFTQVLTLNSPGSGPQSLAWPEVKALRLDKSNSRLYPLPPTAFPANSLLYGILNRLAMFVDGINRHGQGDEYVYFTNADKGTGSFGSTDFSRSIRINLSDLNGDDRARLHYAVRKWAPHVVVDEAVQERMMGTAVLQAPRYTQLWFELLADKMPIRRAGMLSPGSKLDEGALTVKERLSSGGQANIYLAQQEDGCEVVVKEFILSTSDVVGALVESAGEFETEATILSELCHPRIVKMQRFFAEDRRLYIILEKIDGLSLRQLVKSRKSPLSEKKTIEFALEVCDVLQYLHAQQPPVVHRDIAPDNLMFSQAEGLKVIDFSLAAAKKARRTTSTMGKHSYAPPEQFREQPCPQSDIYALGASMYFLLTGEDPKPITTSDVKTKRPEISEALNDIIKRATAFDLADRYPAVEWMKLDLEAVLTAS